MYCTRLTFLSLLIGGALLPALAPAQNKAQSSAALARKQSKPSNSSVWPRSTRRVGFAVANKRRSYNADTGGKVQEQGISEAGIRHNLDGLNALRAKAGVPALKLDNRLSEFARQGSLELMKTHKPHGHFKAADVWDSGFEKAAAENQGDPHGWTPGPVNGAIDQILKAMMDEGPGGGHHDTIISPKYKRVGIGLVLDKNGRLYLTNDFSG